MFPIVLSLVILVLSCVSMTTRGLVQSISQKMSIVAFVLFIGAVLFHFNVVNVSSLSSFVKPLFSRDTVFVHDTTVIIDSVFVTEENGPAQDGTETATEAPKPKKAPSVTKERQRNGRILVFFIHADWCGWCRKMEETTWKDKRLAQEMAVDSVIFIDVNTSKSSTKWIDGSEITTDEARSRSGYDGLGIPATVIKHGSHSETLVGCSSTAEVMASIRRAK